METVLTESRRRKNSQLNLPGTAFLTTQNGIVQCQAC